MKKNTRTEISRPPWAGLVALAVAIIWLAYLGSLTQLITNALSLTPTSFLWCLIFPFLLPISPVIACFMFEVWAPLGIALTLPALSALFFWWEGRNG